MNASGFGKDRVEAGQKGEMNLAKLFYKTGLLDLPNVYTFWSLYLPGTGLDVDVDCAVLVGNTILLVDAKMYKSNAEYVYTGDGRGQLTCTDTDVDVDCAVLVGNTILLVDAKMYKSNAEYIYTGDGRGQLTCTDTTTGNVVKTYQLSRSMPMARDKYAEYFTSESIIPVVTLCPGSGGNAAVGQYVTGKTYQLSRSMPMARDKYAEYFTSESIIPVVTLCPGSGGNAAVGQYVTGIEGTQVFQAYDLAETLKATLGKNNTPANPEVVEKLKGLLKGIPANEAVEGTQVFQAYDLAETLKATLGKNNTPANPEVVEKLKGLLKGIPANEAAHERNK